MATQPDPMQIVQLFQKMHDAMHQCDFAYQRSHFQSLIGWVRKGYWPTAMLVASLYDMPELQKLVVSKQIANATPLTGKFKISPLIPPRKIRVGYLSADFYEHATAYLFLGTLQQHNKDCFEWYLYDYSPEAPSQMRQDMLACGIHRPLQQLSDSQAAELIKSDAIDILIDMKGHIAGNRMGILPYRPAPIIVNYLAYPGTNGPCTDYVITDPFTFNHTSHFHEKPIFLPTFYLPYGTQYPKPTQADITRFKVVQQIADGDMVIGCLNASYKFTLDMVAVWKNVLQHHPQVKLLLLATTDQARIHLQTQFAEVSTQVRLLGKGSVADHLLRIASLDLFVDSFPVCAHTVALDAAYVGTPVLSLSGLTYITRVSSSVNRWMGLNALCADNIKAYKKTLIELVKHPNKLAELKAQVIANSHKVLHQSLASELETIYQQLAVQHSQGA